MWEYKKKEFKVRTDCELIEALNNEGQKNWEIIHYVEDKPIKLNDVTIIHILFKRQKNDLQ